VKLPRGISSPFIVNSPMVSAAELPPLTPAEQMDLEIWAPIFDADAALKRSPLRVLARDMRVQLEVRAA
jgi:hypothetical protein